jgi:NADPH:quinone reductase-like Zn-dependent oxidoreductase
VLIHGAGGGVGHLAVQIAKARGAHVTGTASAAKHDFVASLGADELIDYRATDFAAHADGVDVVLDTIGGDTAPAPSACCGPVACWSRSWAAAMPISPRAPRRRAAVSRA